MQNDSDQWKGDGDCDRCRRKEYCKTECKAHRKHVKEIQDALFNQIMNGFMRENNRFAAAIAEGWYPLDLIGAETDATVK